MLRLRSRPSRPPRLSPTLEALEGRTLATVGQISLSFTSVVGTATPVVQGTLPDVNHSIDVLDYSFSTANPTTIGSAATGAGAGKPVFGALTITAAVGPQSAPLYQVETTGGHFQTARLIVRNSAAQQVAAYDFALVLVSSISTSFSTDDTTPTETYQFLYGSLRQTTYNPITNTVTNITTWSQVTNSPGFTVALRSLDTSNINATSVATPGPADISLRSTATAADAGAGPVGTKVTLHSHSQAGPGGPTVTYTASVTSAAGVPTGDVTFYVQATRLGDAPVGPGGTAILTVPASAVGSTRARPYAIYSGSADSTFQPGSSVTNGAQVRRLFRTSMGRSMTPDEWVLTSMWINQGKSTKQMGSIYRSLAKSLR
jgi:type VI protein secretion system component Hcp